MTRARAVELLKGIQLCCDLDDCTNSWDCDECNEAFNMAIDALSENKRTDKRAETHACDCISRQELLDRCDFVIQKGIADNNGYHMVSAEKVKEVIESLPPDVPPADRHGKWIIEIDTGEEMLRCSECDNRVIKKWYRLAVGTDANKCPYCGAGMGSDGE